MDDDGCDDAFADNAADAVETDGYDDMEVRIFYRHFEPLFPYIFMYIFLYCLALIYMSVTL